MGTGTMKWESSEELLGVDLAAIEAIIDAKSSKKSQIVSEEVEHDIDLDCI